MNRAAIRALAEEVEEFTQRLFQKVSELGLSDDTEGLWKFDSASGEVQNELREQAEEVEE